MRVGQILTVCGILLTSLDGRAEGVQFFEGSVPEAKREAQRLEQNLLVEVYADWCGPCMAQKSQIFDTKQGLNLTHGLLSLRTDFDAPAQQEWMKKWKVLNLPTVLFLRPDGSEIGRVEGYEDKAKFLSEANVLAAGKDPLPDLMRQWKEAAPGTGKELELRVQVGHWKLVRGKTEEGLKLLESAIVDDRTGQAGAAERALFLVGRYYSRVNNNHHVGRHIWRTLYLQFPDGKYENTAAWWYAGDLEHANRRPEALAFLQRRVEADLQNESALWALVEFEVKAGRVAPKTRAIIKKARISRVIRAEINSFIREKCDL